MLCPRTGDCPLHHTSGWIAMFMDLLDGQFDNKVHL